MAVASTVRGPSPNTDVSPDTTVLPAPDPDNPGIGQARRSPISCSACWHAVAGEVHDLCPIRPKIMPPPFRRPSHDVTAFLAPREAVRAGDTCQLPVRVEAASAAFLTT